MKGKTKFWAGIWSKGFPYLLVLLVPLLWVGLDSYGWLFLHPQASPLPLQGFLPRQITADQRHTLQLKTLSPSGTELKLQLQRSDNGDRFLIPIQAQDGLWQASLPPLEAGKYEFHWQGPGAEQMPVLPLDVQTPPQWQMRLDQMAYQPGQTLLLSLNFIAPPDGQDLALALRDASGQVQQQIHWHWPHNQQSFRDFRWPLSRQLKPGAYRLEISPAGLPAQQCSLEILAPESAHSAELSAWLQESSLSTGFAHELQVFVLDPQGQAVDSGWLQVLKQTYPVQHGRARIQLPADFHRSVLPYAAGDSRGNLQQGRWALHWLDLPWQVQPSATAAGLWQIQTHPGRKRGQKLHWLLSQNGAAVAQGLVSLQQTEQELDLRSQSLQAGRASLLLRDEWGRSAQLDWWVPAEASGQFVLVPQSPHALNSLRIQPSQAFLKQSEALEASLYHLGPWRVLTPTVSERTAQSLSVLGFPEPAQPHPFWLLIWFLTGLVVASLPWLWCWSQQRGQRRPFPTEAIRQARRRGQRRILIWTVLLLPALLLSWGHLQGNEAGGFRTWFWAWPVLSLLVGGFLFPGTLKVLLPQKHALTPWLPFLQVLMLLWLFWFTVLYAPAYTSGVILWTGLMALGWWFLLQRLVAGQAESRNGVVVLASLTVLTALNLLLLGRGLWAAPLHSETTAHLAEMRLAGLQRERQLLQHESFVLPPTQVTQDFVLPPAYQPGTQLVELRSWQGLQSHLAKREIRIRPAVLAALNAPHMVQAGDRLTLSLSFENQTSQRQQIDWRLGHQAPETRHLAAGEQAHLDRDYTFLGRGVQDLLLQERFQGTWFPRHYSVLVLQPEAPHQDPQLKLKLRLPKAQGLVPGEEIPVLVALKQETGKAQTLGLQLGLPAGFRLLDDTIRDSANRDWLAAYEPTAAYLNLRTRKLPSGQEVSFHFRLQAEIPGSVSLPPARLFLLDAPAHKTILPVQKLETQRESNP